MRLLEGDPVPRGVALLCMSWLRSSETVDDFLPQPVGDLIEMAGSRSKEMLWKIQVSEEDYFDRGLAAVRAVLGLVERATTDGRINEEGIHWEITDQSATEIFCTTQVPDASDGVFALLQIAMVGLQHAFTLPSVDGPISPVSSVHLL